MKHLSLLSMIAFLFFLLFPLNINYVNAEEHLSLNTKYYVLMEPVSKKVILQSNPHDKLYPASMTKMMGMLLILEALEEGRISLDDKVICSEYASNMGGTQIYLEPGEEMLLEDLFKAVAINSANDAIVCLGEHLEGSNEGFVKKMNQRAKELNMVNTSFKNATGFDDEEHYSSCLDMALLGCELLKYEEMVLKYSSLKESYIREDSSSPFWLVNTNKLLGHYQGLDGLKTGFTSLAGYNLTATAKRNGVRLLSVVMHEETIQKRSQDTCSLLNYGFSLLKEEVLFTSNEVICNYQIKNSLTKEIGIKVKEDIKVILDKEESKDDLVIELIMEQIEAPIEEDQKVGYIKVTTLKGREYVFDVYSTVNVKKLSLGDIFVNNLKIIFS